VMRSLSAAVAAAACKLLMPLARPIGVATQATARLQIMPIATEIADTSSRVTNARRLKI
jgi:hypothetical protein